MDFLKRMFSKKQEKPPEEPVDITARAKRINALIDSSVNEIVKLNLPTFLTNPITYIVYAVWGANGREGIDDTQKDINSRIEPVIKQAKDLIDLPDIPADRAYTMDFLLRGLYISKSTYMIELARNQLHRYSEQSHEEESEKIDLSTVEEWLEKIFNKDGPSGEDDNPGNSGGKRW